MELDELTNSWQALSKRVENQEILSNQILEKITREKYHSKINKIGYSEYVGTIICYIGAAYLIMNFAKIDGALIQLFAIIAIALLFILPVISLKSVRAVKNVSIASKTYLQSIEEFAARKARFLRLQRLNVLLGFFLILVAVPILSAIQGKDIAQVPRFWTLIFPISIVFFSAFAFWVLRSYNRVLTDIEKTLAENQF